MEGKLMLNFKDVSVDDVLKEMDKLNFKSVKDAFNFNESLFKGPKRDYKKDRLRLFYCNCNFYFAFYEVINEIIYQYFHIDYRVRPEVMKHQSCYFLDNFISWVKINLSGHIAEYITEDERNAVNELLGTFNSDDESFKDLQNKLAGIASKVFFASYERYRTEYMRYVKNTSCNCQIDCRQGLIMLSGIKNYLYKFEGNYFFADPGSNTYIASDNRKLRWLVRAMPLVNITNNINIDEALIINDVYKAFNEDEVQCLNSCRYTDNFCCVRNNLLNYLRESFLRNKLTADNSSYLKKQYDISKHILMSMNGPINNRNLKFFWDHRDSKIGNKNLSWAKLAKTLYLLTNGDKQCLDELAKLITKIIIGTEVCKQFDLKVKKATVVICNNKTFALQFLQSIFLMGALPSGFSLKEFYDLTHNSVSYDQLKNIKYWGITDYNLSELSNPSNTGIFLEDKLYSRILNITKEGGKIIDETYLNNLIAGRVVNGNNEYLGKQSLTSEVNYVFIVNRKEEVEKINSDNYDEINLSESIPEDLLYFNKDTELSDWEKFFILNDLARYGVKLLLNAEHEEENKVPKITDPVEFFTEKCCDKKEITEGDKPDAANATAMRTFGKAYNLFYNIVGKEYQLDDNQFNKNIGEKYKFPYSIVGSERGNDIRERDLQNGYAEDEVLKHNSKANICLGLVIKPKQEILKIAEDYAENVNAHKQIFTETEFISFIGNLCIDESELSRSNSRKRY